MVLYMQNHRLPKERGFGSPVADPLRKTLLDEMQYRVN